MQTWTIRQKILGSFAAIIALMIVMGSVAYNRLATIKREATNVERHSLPGVYYTARIHALWEANFGLTTEHILQEEKSKKDQEAQESTPTGPRWKIW